MQKVPLFEIVDSEEEVVVDERCSYVCVLVQLSVYPSNFLVADDDDEKTTHFVTNELEYKQPIY